VTTVVSVDSPTVTLKVPREVRARDSVPMTVHVANATSQPLTLYLRGRPIAFDLVVTGADGTVVWRRLEGAMISMVLQVRTLSPGEALELRDVWPQTTRAGAPVPPGKYTVRGEVLTDKPRPLATPPAPLRILPASAR
jgi:hypothetical protein